MFEDFSRCNFHSILTDHVLVKQVFTLLSCLLLPGNIIGVEKRVTYPQVSFEFQGYGVCVGGCGCVCVLHVHKNRIRSTLHPSIISGGSFQQHNWAQHLYALNSTISKFFPNLILKVLL